MKVLSATPILVVDRIEPLLPYWVERFGYTKIAEVRHGEALGFAILDRDGHQLMLQTRDSIADDAPFMLPLLGPNAVVQFLEVDDLDDVLRRLDGIEVVVPERTTFYGMREVFVRDAAGFVTGFAQKVG